MIGEIGGQFKRLALARAFPLRRCEVGAIRCAIAPYTIGCVAARTHPTGMLGRREIAGRRSDRQPGGFARGENDHGFIGPGPDLVDGFNVVIEGMKMDGNNPFRLQLFRYPLQHFR